MSGGLKMGLGETVAPRMWKEAAVAEALAAASNYLSSHCGASEVEALRHEPRPEDDELEVRLHAIERTLNAFVSSGDDTEQQLPTKKSNAISSPEAVAETPEEFSLRSSYVDCASEYMRWLANGDSFVQDIRRHFELPLTEVQMIKLLSSQLLGALSFSELEHHELSPWATGRIISAVEQASEVPSQLEAAKAMGARLPGCDCKPQQYVLTVEVERPGGGTEYISVLREDGSAVYEYHSELRDDFLDAGHHVLWPQVRIDIRKEFVEQCLAQGYQPDDPEFARCPHFHFRGYKGSAIWWIFALCTSLLENDFCRPKHGNSAALRFIFMSQYKPVVDFQVRRADAYSNDQSSYLAGNFILHVPCWALPEEVADFWRKHRPSTARERRMPSQKSLDQFDFVLRNTPPAGTFRWAKLAKLWQKQTHEYITRDSLYKTFASVRDALFPPGAEGLKGPLSGYTFEAVLLPGEGDALVTFNEPC